MFTKYPPTAELCKDRNKLIFLNNQIIATFRFPIVLTLEGMVFSSVISLALMLSGVSERKRAKGSLSLRFYLRNVAPIGGMIAITIWQGNRAYMFLSVAYIQMIKAWTPMMVVGLNVLSDKQLPPRTVLIAVMILVTGTMISSVGELRFSVDGIVAILASCACEAMRLMMQQKLLTNHSFGVVEGIACIYPAAAVLLVFLFYAFEYERFQRVDGYGTLTAHWQLISLACLLGFLVNFAGSLVIKYCSSLTLKVLASARNAAIVLFAAGFFHEPVTAIQCVGYCITLVGFSLYQNATQRAKTIDTNATKSTLQISDGMIQQLGAVLRQDLGSEYSQEQWGSLFDRLQTDVNSTLSFELTKKDLVNPSPESLYSASEALVFTFATRGE